MINLLPPDIKSEITYSKRNALLMRYVKGTVAISLLLAGALLGGRLLLNQQVKEVDARMADKQTQIASYSKVEKDAKKLNERLTSIAGIQKSQSKFSVLLSDLAQDMPQGTSITSIILTGDDKKPVRLIVHAQDYKTALGFRDSIVRSKRISAADIENIQAIQENGQNLYQVTVSFTFNPGAAR